MSDTEFWKELEYVEIRAPRGGLSDDAKKCAVRLYCTTADTSWCLQIRAQETLASGMKGQKYLIASATLDRETMLELHAAIAAHLVEYEEFRDTEDKLIGAIASAARRANGRRLANKPGQRKARARRR